DEEPVLSDITNIRSSNKVDILVIINNYCNKTTSPFDPARSHILDMMPESMIQKGFNADD
ncbi:2672_t:CDS:2, partial [Entrophospora sp. SA101]